MQAFLFGILVVSNIVLWARFFAVVHILKKIAESLQTLNRNDFALLSMIERKEVPTDAELNKPVTTVTQ